MTNEQLWALCESACMSLYDGGAEISIRRVDDAHAEADLTLPYDENKHIRGRLSEVLDALAEDLMTFGWAFGKMPFN